MVQRPGLGRVNGFVVPNLVVGTLDSLMSLSDDLRKTNTIIENVVRKVEKQYADVGGFASEPLRVDGMSPADYLRGFQWDFARFPRKPLPELVAGMQQSVGRVEEELRRLSAAYSDKVQALGALKRRKAANLATADLEDLFTRDMLATAVRNGWLVPPSSEYLASLLVAVPVSAEEEFLATYATLGADIAAYGGPEWTRFRQGVGQPDGNFGPTSARNQRRGSPVVPGSAHPMLREGDYALYALTVLRGQYEAGRVEDRQFVQGQYVDYLPRFKEACREKRYVARDLLSFDVAKCGGVDAALEEAVRDVEQATSTVVRWCAAHFGEALAAWVHLKVVHGFVESVLRYGLPVNFTAAFVELVEGKDALALVAMSEAIGLAPEGAAPGEAEEDDGDEEGGAGNSAVTVGHGAVPYVWMKFTVVTGSAAAKPAAE